MGHFDGVGRQRTSAFAISDDAVQWRLRWACERGRSVVRAPGRPEPLIDAVCAGRTIATELSGKVDGALEVETDGPWTARVDALVPAIESATRRLRGEPGAFGHRGGPRAAPDPMAGRGCAAPGEHRRGHHRPHGAGRDRLPADDRDLFYIERGLTGPLNAQ